jgi:hypothetical protein
MKKLFLLTGILACALSTTFLITSCQEDEAISPAIENLKGPGATPNVAAYSPRVPVFGHTYNEWTQKWWKYMLSIPSDRNPINDKTGANALVGQNGPVIFLAGANAERVDRNITVTSDKALLIPVVTALITFPCPNNASQPKPGQSLEDFLKEGARAMVDQVQIVKVTVDGKDITNLGDYRVTSDVFQAGGSPDLNICYEGCITPEPRKAVSDGYFILLKGLKKGDHSIEFSGEIAGTRTPAHVTYKVKVTR